MQYLLILSVVSLLIALHELGHFLAAKVCGIPVARFSVGFGPKVFGFTRHETSYWLSAVPIGGYVLPAVDEDEFRAFPRWRRIVFALAGPAANLAGAFVALVGLNLLTTEQGLVEILNGSAFQLVMFSQQLLGAIPGLFASPGDVSGIIGIVTVGGAEFGTTISGVLAFCVMLNVNLAILNLLPIPPLDGARVVFCLVERLAPGFVRMQQPVTVAGWGFILLVMIYATAQDLMRLV